MERDNKVDVVILSGSLLERGNAQDFHYWLKATYALDKEVLFDMSQVQRVDGFGLKAMLGIQKYMCQRGGDLKLCGLNKAVHMLFELVGLHRVFEIFSTREEALRAFDSQARPLAQPA